MESTQLGTSQMMFIYLAGFLLVGFGPGCQVDSPGWHNFGSGPGWLALGHVDFGPGWFWAGLALDLVVVSIGPGWHLPWSLVDLLWARLPGLGWLAFWVGLVGFGLGWLWVG